MLKGQSRWFLSGIRAFKYFDGVLFEILSEPYASDYG